MPTRGDNIDAALDNVAVLMRDMTASPKPTYQVGGKQVQWGEYLQMLLEQQDALYRARQLADGPFEVRSRGLA